MKRDFKTVEYVDLQQFIAKWYVIGGRFTFFEKNAHNPVEEYTWAENKEYIKVNFYFNEGSFNGKLKTLGQKAWIENTKTNAHWKIQPFWPLKFNYIVIDLAEDYSWCVVGVPGETYVWIMSKSWDMSDEQFEKILQRLDKIGFSTKNIKRAPQRWE
ncbi:MAG: lipocalin family protein [Bacteriovoracaceae bacterium]|jgi:apolipoprotein D and lipocalin family protein|nr:lipocalin family protein [Bacteriovoracaceae bacterium]|tara:strand:+ start:391 stop:861 length:471 start_codon:yes stop_codon:yes gene_type:complete